VLLVAAKFVLTAVAVCLMLLLVVLVSRELMDAIELGVNSVREKNKELKNLKYMRIDGSTPAKQREANVSMFQEQADCRVSHCEVGVVVSHCEVGVVVFVHYLQSWSRLTDYGTYSCIKGAAGAPFVACS
jgi:hypothetical protein